MATTIDTSSAATTATASPASSATTNKTAEASGGADRFLKLLVAQMKNQDPLNPMDNAEVTSQMAQISTVTGIEKLNQSLAAMNGSFGAMQAMQSASLVGRGVMVPGATIRLDAKGNGGGGFELEAPAERVRVDILSTSGTVLDTIELGKRAAGRHSFDWALKNGIKAENVAAFQVTAVGAGQAVAASTLKRDSVRSVVADGNQITLELTGGGTVPYSQVKAFN